MLRLLIIIILSLWIFYDAQKKGSSFFKALLWAFIFGVSGIFFQFLIFLPLYFFLRQKKQKRTRKNCSDSEVIDVKAVIIDDKIYNHCHICKRKIKDKNGTCLYCDQK